MGTRFCFLYIRQVSLSLIEDFKTTKINLIVPENDEENPVLGVLLFHQFSLITFFSTKTFDFLYHLTL